MKGLFRHPAVQAALGWTLGLYLRLVLATVRWRHENLACVEPVLERDDVGAIALFWHGRVPLCLATAPQWWRKRTRAFVSPSADGEFIARRWPCRAFRRSASPRPRRATRPRRGRRWRRCARRSPGSPAAAPWW